MVAEQISDRLALVLAERSPRRAQLDADQRAQPPATQPPETQPPATQLPDTQPPNTQPLAAPRSSPGGDRDHPAADVQPDRHHAPVTAPLSAAGLDASQDLHELDELPPVRRFSRRHLAVLSGLVVVGLLVAGWSMFRARPVAIATPGSVAVSSSTPAASGAAGATPAPVSPKPTIVVHILGEVRRPGLVTLPDPARVQDAIDAAGGLKSGADPGDLNLAQQLADGQQVVISRGSDPPSEVRDGGSQGASGGTQGGGGAASSVLDLNRATPAQLEALPGVGPVTATKIMAWREEHGRFSRVEELQEIDGIGPKIYAQIAPHVRV